MIASIHEYAWLIPILPSCMSTILALALLMLRRAINTQRTLIASLNIITLVIVMFLSIGLVWDQINHNVAHQHLWLWLQIDEWCLNVGYLVDPLSAIMLVVVTTVAITVMIYSHGYMEHDEGYVRFFIYLTLFTASMLGLILSPNLVQIYIFWELVGMCSYLLVGFWFTRPSAAYACQKAFVTNRVGDFGLLLGLLGIYWFTGNLEFDQLPLLVHTQLSTNSLTGITICCLGLFLGPIAKSAQFPLHVWLPDAMEGPTPISALIHAATMVAAGVFLVARLLPLFEYVPFVMDCIAYTGTITAVLGATLALGQYDLKKGLAYSTMSQLGYMILALGVGAYQAGFFHLITHAYSKALLFLASGSVIHGVEPVVGYHPNRSQNMLYMGGLRQYMPVTARTFLLGTLSLCGVPPLACFWSKDQILSETWKVFPALGFLVWLTAGLTAFYMFRIYFLTFEGKFRGNLLGTHTESLISGFKEVGILNSLNTVKPHESSWSMRYPLLILTLPTCLLGFLGAPFPNGLPNSSILSHWLHTNSTLELTENGWQELFFDASPSVIIAVVGASLAWWMYAKTDRTDIITTQYQLDPVGEGVMQPLMLAIYTWSLQRGYIDQLYDIFYVQFTRRLATTLAWIDQWLIDGLVNSSGLVLLLGGESGRYTEGGRVNSYIFVFTVGFTLLLVAILTTL